MHSSKNEATIGLEIVHVDLTAGMQPPPGAPFTASDVTAGRVDQMCLETNTRVFSTVST